MLGNLRSVSIWTLGKPTSKQTNWHGETCGWSFQGFSNLVAAGSFLR